MLQLSFDVAWQVMNIIAPGQADTDGSRAVRCLRNMMAVRD